MENRADRNRSTTTLTVRDRWPYRLGVALILFTLTGCQALIYGTAADLNELRLGMTKDEVIGIMGTPVSVAASADTGEEILVYKRMRHAISDWPRFYLATMRDGKLVRYGEAPTSPSSDGGGRRLAIEIMPGVWSY